MSASAKLSIVAPQLDDAENRNGFIELASLQVNQSWFGDKSEWAIAFLAAHLISVNPQNGDNMQSGGVVTSKREGDLAVSYAGPSAGDDAELSRTSYGRQFLSLRKQGNAFIGITGGNDASLC